MSVEKDFVDSYPPNLREKLVLCSENLDKLDLYQPDKMHDALHIAQVGRNVGWMTDSYDLKPKQRTLLDQAVPLHDLGYAFVDMGFLTPQEHDIGSGLIALWKTGDHNLAKGIALHSLDVLPKGTPRWVYVLREADRVDRLGWQGVIFLAYYMGFRHELVNGPLSYQINLDGKSEVHDPLRDIRHPDEVDYKYIPIIDGSYPVRVRWTWTDYEQEAAEFTRKHIFPFLHAKGLIGKMVDELFKVTSWEEGEEEKDSKSNRIKWKVEPASGWLSYAMFSAKRFNTNQAISELHEYKYLKEKDVAKLNNWENSKLLTVNTQKRDKLLLTLKHVQPAGGGSRSFKKELRESLKNPDITHEIIYYFSDEYHER